MINPIEAKGQRPEARDQRGEVRETQSPAELGCLTLKPAWSAVLTSVYSYFILVPLLTLSRREYRT
jgi:hypothetical protein